MIREAFFQTCQEAQPANKQYVSLYIVVPFYGGPEEGGWWGSDTHLLAYNECTTADEAERVREQVMVLADELSQTAKEEFGQRCLDETRWLEARGLDDNFLPEVSGEEKYIVMVEQTPGENVNIGSRHWE